MNAIHGATNASSLEARRHYAIDTTHANAQFKVRHLMVANVRGELGPIVGRAILDPHDPSRSEVVASIDARGVDTRNESRDAHLRSADFLDVERYPSIEFRSTRVEGTFDALVVTGVLTIKRVAREVRLDAQVTGEVRDPWGNVKRGVSATTRIHRHDFGLTWNAALEAGGIAVGEIVEIAIDLELTLDPR